MTAPRRSRDRAWHSRWWFSKTVRHPLRCPRSSTRHARNSATRPQTCPAGVIGPMVNDEYSDVTFALYALKAKGEPQRRLGAGCRATAPAAATRARASRRSTSSASRPNGSSSSSPMIGSPRWACLPRTSSPRSNSCNVMTPAGSIEAKGPQVFIRLDGAIDDLQAIRDTAVAARGRTLKLSGHRRSRSAGTRIRRPSSSATTANRRCCWVW